MRRNCSAPPVEAWLIAAAAILSFSPVLPAAEPGVDRLRREYCDNPLGIDLAKSLLSWIMEARDQDGKVSAWSSPATKNLIKPLAGACRKYGIRLCLYHSIIDRHNRDYGRNTDACLPRMKARFKELLTSYSEIGSLKDYDRRGVLSSDVITGQRVPDVDREACSCAQVGMWERNSDLPSWVSSETLLRGYPFKGTSKALPDPIATVVTVGITGDGDVGKPAVKDPSSSNPFGEPYATNGAPSAVNMDLCPRGKWEIGRDQWGGIVRVNMLEMADGDWGQVPGIKKAWRMRGYGNKPAEVFHPVMSEIKDVDGDGTLDIFHLRSPDAGARIERLRYQDGAVVWESEPVGGMSGDESRLAVFGLNRKDDWCVFYADQGGAYCFDAVTGKTRWKQSDVRGDVKDAAYTVGHFLNREQSAMAVHANGVITCLDAAGRPAWTYDTGLRGRDAYGHEVLCADADGDGLDEIFVVVQRRALALRGDGKLLWQDRKQARHSDYLWCGDLDVDGRKEFVYDHEGCGGRGPAQFADALTGQVKLKIDYRAAGVGHAQNLAVGNFDKDRDGLEIALCDKHDGFAVWAANGELLWQRKVPTSLISSGDWDGDGADDIMVFGLGANVDGIFSVWNGKGERLYAIAFLPSPSRAAGDRARSHAMPGGHEGVRRQVDLDGNGKADVIMPFGTWKHGPDSILFLMEKTIPLAPADRNPRPQPATGGGAAAQKPDASAFSGAWDSGNFTGGGRGGDVDRVTNFHGASPVSMRSMTNSTTTVK